MEYTLKVGDTVMHHLGGPSDKISEIFVVYTTAYAFLENQLGAAPLNDLIKVGE